MTRLVWFLHTMIGSTLAAVAVVVALVAGVTGLWPLLGAALAGWIASLPIAILVARRMR